MAASHRVSQAKSRDVLPVQRYQRSRVECCLHGIGIADGRDHVGRAVGTTVQQQGVADTSRYRARDQALIILHLNGLGARTPQGIEHTFDILLVHHQVIR
jgi:hypothetical protein